MQKKLVHNISYEKLTPAYFKQVIELANKVHGTGYLNDKSMADWAARGISTTNKDEIDKRSNIHNCSYVALLNSPSNTGTEHQEIAPQLVGFRITFTADKWQADQWCTPKSWHVPKNQCCYFKCNTVDDRYRGLGIGKKLLQLSIQAAKKQGAQAGIAHLWKQSPNNSAVAYFMHCGGELINYHPDKWNKDSKEGYLCTLCGNDCHCEAVEMIIRFN